jgi:sulfatase modifying factor 1
MHNLKPATLSPLANGEFTAILLNNCAMLRGIVFAVLLVALVSDRGYASNAVITLEKISPDFTVIQKIPLSPDMVTSDGNIVLRAVPAGSSGFFRVKLALDNMTEVVGGNLPSSSELAGREVKTFLLSRYETTFDEWKFVRQWALANGYDLADRGYGNAGDHPVRYVDWYDAVKWCNAKSEMEGLVPVYTIEGKVYRSGKFGAFGSDAISFNPVASGYRLPTDAEWEWAARGGILSQNFEYSGSNNASDVSWHVQNTQTTSRVGQKQSNELGLHDMSGNVCEWCWDFAVDTSRILRGGGFDGQPSLGKVSLRIPFGVNTAPNVVWQSHGFRYARNVVTK